MTIIPSPDQINATQAKPVYHCRNCRVTTGLHWYRGTSCPVCSNPICLKALDEEWQASYDAGYDED